MTTAVTYPTVVTARIADLKRPGVDATRARCPSTTHVVRQSVNEFGLLALPTWNARTGRLLSLRAVVESMVEAGEETCQVLAVWLEDAQEAAAVLMLNSHLNEFVWSEVAIELKKIEKAGIPVQLSGLHESDTGPLMAADWSPAAKVALNDVHADAKQGGLFT